MLFSQQSFDYSQDSVCTDYGGGITELEPPCLGPKKRPRAMRLDQDDENDRAYNVYSQDDGSLCGSQPFSQEISDRFQTLALFKASQEDSCQSVSSSGARRALFGEESNSGDATTREYTVSRPPLRAKGSDDSFRGVTQRKLPAPIVNPFLPADQLPPSKKRHPTVVPMPSVMPSRFKLDYDDPIRIGQGNFSVVWQARSRLDGALYAIKQLKQPFTGTKRREQMLREVCAYAVLQDCPFLVKYHGCWVEDNTLHIATGYCQGQNLETAMNKQARSAPSRQKVPLFDSSSDTGTDLSSSSEVPIFSHIQAVQAGVRPGKQPLTDGEQDDPVIVNAMPSQTTTSNKIEEGAAWKMLYCISSALAHMHSKGIAHLDVRPANIFQDGEFVKLGDLGSVTALNEQEEVSGGEERYVPRELVDSDRGEVDLAKADVFSLGASLYELCLGREIAAAGEEWHAIRDGDLCENSLAAYSEALQHLVRRMLEAVPFHRPPASEIHLVAAQELLRRSATSLSNPFQNTLLRSLIEQAGFSG